MGTDSWQEALKDFLKACTELVKQLTEKLKKEDAE